jgi:hypothetical protein
LAFIVLVVVEPLGDIFGLSTLPLPVWAIVIGLGRAVVRHSSLRLAMAVARAFRRR